MQSRTASIQPLHGRWRDWLVWGLVAILPWFGLGATQRQSLGPLHVHAVAPATAAAAQPVGSPMQQAWSWWWAQVQQQVQARQHARAHAEGLHHAHAAAAAGPHAHEAWQRHHHRAELADVIELDEPVDTLAAAGWLMPSLGAPAHRLQVPAAALRSGGWPRTPAVRFSSVSTAPALRPPSV